MKQWLAIATLLLSPLCIYGFSKINDGCDYGPLLHGPLEQDAGTELALMKRRTVLSTFVTGTVSSILGGVSAAFASQSPPPQAENSILLSDLLSTQAESTNLPQGLLESRVMENVMSPPPYGMEGPDVFYPSWFVGKWHVESIATSVEAPCGVALFGGNKTFQAAQAQLGKDNALQYDARFIAATTGSSSSSRPDDFGETSDAAIADRDYNVRSIAQAAMGQESVIDVSLATPNKFSCLLAPEGSPNMLTVDLIVLNRREENKSNMEFDCSEVVREITSPVNLKNGNNNAASSRASPLLKEIETASLYTAVMDESNNKKGGGGVSKIRCRQRSAAFLLPSQQDPIAMQMFQYARGRPIDVRFYDVYYTKQK